MANLEKVGSASGETKLLLDRVSAATEGLLKSTRELDAATESGSSSEKLAALANVREMVDELEGLVPYEAWPLPSYTELMFMM